jgi:hypothetical protein
MTMRAPTIIETSNDRLPARVAWWRRNIMGLTVAELAAAIGYEPGAIYRLERGHNSKGQLFKPNAWKRYLRACKGLAHERGRQAPCEVDFQ